MWWTEKSVSSFSSRKIENPFKFTEKQQKYGKNIYQINPLMHVTEYE
jgi:hypothetical protein